MRACGSLSAAAAGTAEGESTRREEGSTVLTWWCRWRGLPATAVDEAGEAAEEGTGVGSSCRKVGVGAAASEEEGVSVAEEVVECGRSPTPLPLLASLRDGEWAAGASTEKGKRLLL